MLPDYHEGLIMSTTVRTPDFDPREHLARIDRTQAEIQKLFAEQTKLNHEARELDAERDKLFEEGQKFSRERWVLMVAFVSAASALVGALAGAAILQAVVHLAARV